MGSALPTLLPVLIGLVWGVSNPFTARGVRTAAATPPEVRTGVVALDGLLHHLFTPSFIVPQALNLCGSLLFAAALPSGDVSIVAPISNGVSLAATAVFDSLLGDRPSRPRSCAVGLALVVAGVTLCTLAGQQAGQQQP